MAVKARYNVSLPDHVSTELEKHAGAIKATPTEYAGDIIRWWFGQGCPPVRPDEAELRGVKEFNIWKLDPNAMYSLVDEPVEKALRQLGIPNLFARAQEHEKVRLMVAFDNHPTHWLIFNFYKGSDTANGDGLQLTAYSKASTSRDEMLGRLDDEAKEMNASGPVTFSQIPIKKAVSTETASK